MQNNELTAGKTAQKLNLTEKQQQELIELTQELGITTKLISKTAKTNGNKRFIVFDCGGKAIAATAETGLNYFDGNGEKLPISHDEKLFEIINDYFTSKKDELLEKIYGIYQDSLEGGAE